MKKVVVTTAALLSLGGLSGQVSATEPTSTETSRVVSESSFPAQQETQVGAVISLLTPQDGQKNRSECQKESFTVKKAIRSAEKALDNDDLVFSSDGILHKDENGRLFYNLKAQSKELMDKGGSGTVGFYDVFQNGDVVESTPR